jgi:hypothetical protein
MNHYKDACNAKDPKDCDSEFLKPQVEDEKFAKKFGEILLQKVETVLKNIQLYNEQ